MRTDTYHRNPLRFFATQVGLLRTCVLMGAALCTLLLCAPATQAQSGDIIYVDADAPGNGDGSSWPDAYTNLQDALANATGTDEIWVAGGTYYPDEGTGVTNDDRTASFTVTGNQDGLVIYGGFAGSESVREERAPDANETILSGDIDGDGALASNSYHVLVFNAGNDIGADVAPNITTDTVLDGVTVTGGNADAIGNSSGGGLFCDGLGSANVCSPTLRGITFIENNASSGGAIYNSGSGGESSPHIINSTFISNTAGASGAAIKNEGDSGGTSSPKIVGSTFIDNEGTGPGPLGGAIFNVGIGGGASSPQIIRSIFIGNTATLGGAIYSEGYNGASSPQIVGSIFSGNTADEGGAIYNDGLGGTSSPQIISSTFTGNSANTGGAIYSDGRDFDATAGFRPGTSSPQIINTILWGNTAGSGGELYNVAATPTFEHTLIEGGLDGISENNGSETTDDGNNLDVNPLLVDASAPAGPDGIFGTADDGLQVRAGFPAVDAGTNMPFEPGGSAEAVTTDLRGDARIQDSDGDETATVTLGAYEAAIDAVDLRLTATPTAVAGDDPTSLTFRLTNRGNAVPTGVVVDLAPPSGLALTKTSGSGTLSSGTWTVGSIPGDGGAQLTVEVERTTGTEETLAATATLQSGYTVPAGISDLTDPERSAAEWGALPAPYGSGQALTLDGNGDYVSADTASRTLAGAEAFTMEAWVRLDSNTDRPAVLAFNGAVEDNKNILFYNSGQFQYYDPDITFQPSTDTFAPDQWHHVAVVIEADDSGTLYVNGTEQATFTTSVRPVSGGRFSIGQEWDTSTPSDFFAGQIDEVRLWDTARSPEEIRTGMHQTIDAPAPGLASYWRFDEEAPDENALRMAYDAAGRSIGMLEGDATRIDASGALLGQTAALLSGGASQTVGPQGGTAQVTNQGAIDAEPLAVYQYGAANGDLVAAGAPGENFGAAGVTQRLNVVWGIEPVAGSSASAEVTFDFSGLAGVSDPGAVLLLKREGPGQPWQDVTGQWALDATAQTFSRSGVSSFSEYAVAGDAQALPVELTGLEAQRSGAEAITVRWQTLSETNNAGFEVQRAAGAANESVETSQVETSQWGVSTTGVSTTGESWQTIAHLDGAGTTDTPQSYRFEDTDLPYAADSLRYRLRQVDTDGTESFSDPVTIARQVTAAELLPTYPNPVRGQATVRFAVPERQNVRIVLYDMLGRRVQTVVDTDAEGRTEAQLDVSSLASGTYFLRMQTEDGPVDTQRVTVVR